MSEVRIPAFSKSDRLVWALLGATALGLFAAGAEHEIKKPGSGLLVTLSAVVVLLGSALLCFLWATASVGITGEHITQYYFGRGFRRQRFDGVESAFLEPWGIRRTGRGPYLTLILRTKTDRRMTFNGLRELAEPTFTRIVERYAVKKPRSNSPKLSFQVGDKVYDTWNKIHTVLEIDRQAEHGLGIIRTQRDSDGVKLGHAVMAHDLTTSLKPHPGPSEEISP